MIQKEQTGHQTHQKENLQKETPETQGAVRRKLPNETRGKNRDQQCQLLDEYRAGIYQLHRITELLRRESAGYPDDLPTSFVRVENEIAKYISGCLSDVDEQSRDISDILTLLRCNRVLVHVHGETPSVSLDQLYILLQDNFPNSYLCNLFNLFIDGFSKVQPKTIAF